MKLSSVSAKTKIRHHNDINKTFRMMPLAARRVLFLTMAQIDHPNKILPLDSIFRITASDYAKICDLKDEHSAYHALREAVKQLQTQVIEIPKEELFAVLKRAGTPLLKREEEYKGKGIRVLNVTAYCDYTQGSGYVDVAFSQQMEPYICMLAGSYTTQVLQSAARLPNGNSGSFYQLIRERVSQGKKEFFDIEVNELKEYLGLYDKKGREKIHRYPKFKDFSRDVITKSLKSINKETEIHFDLKTKDENKKGFSIIEKIGRKAHILRFRYSVQEC